jgi:hypothetical protein
MKELKQVAEQAFKGVRRKQTLVRLDLKARQREVDALQVEAKALDELAERYREEILEKWGFEPVFNKDTDMDDESLTLGERVDIEERLSEL